MFSFPREFQVSEASFHNNKKRYYFKIDKTYILLFFLVKEKAHNKVIKTNANSKILGYIALVVSQENATV